MFIILTLFLNFSSCTETKKSNPLDSEEFETKAERIEILKNEIKSQSEIYNAEFELFNVNGFSNSRVSIPGASSLDYKFVIKIRHLDIDKWKKGMIKASPNNKNLDWTKEIIEHRKSSWETESSPEFYSREIENVIMIVYRNEGIIYKRVTNE